VSDPSAPLPELRASDSERDNAAETIRGAAAEGRLTLEELEDRLGSVYAAQTRAQLELLIADVDPGALTRAAPGAAAASPRVKEGPGGTRWLISIMGGHDRQGHWRVGRQLTVLNVMGGSDLDFNDAEFAEPIVRITVVSIMGGSEIHVPEGVGVHVNSIPIMGGNEIKLGNDQPPPGAPQMHLRLISIMGGNSVQRGRKLSRRERRELKQQQALNAHDRDHAGD
jgi:hypothetical protein